MQLSEIWIFGKLKKGGRNTTAAMGGKDVASTSALPNWIPGACRDKWRIIASKAHPLSKFNNNLLGILHGTP